MGTRTGTETLAAIMVAFWRERTWAQAALAREIGLNVRALRRHLEELEAAGWPFEREEDHPHVYWSVPNDWFPGGVLLGRDELAALLHLLVRLPDSPERRKLEQALTEKAPQLVTRELARVLPPRSSETEENHLPQLLDAVAMRTSLRVRYFTASRGALTERVVSVQRVMPGPPVRFLGYCHTVRDLRWFRLDYVASLQADPAAPFVDVDDADVEALLARSVDGFYGAERKRVTFFVRMPEARWVAKNLPDGLVGVDADGGFLVDCETHGLLPVARFVVGLGSAAECRSEELRALVTQLARGALDQG